MCVRRKVTAAAIALVIAVFPWGVLANDTQLSYNDYVDHRSIIQLCGSYGYISSSDAYILEKDHTFRHIGKFANVPRERIHADVTNARAAIGLSVNSGTNPYYNRKRMKDTCQNLK